MKSNQKQILRNASNSQIKFKLQTKQLDSEPSKQPLRKCSSSLKLNIKAQKSNQIYQSKQQQNPINRIISKDKRSKRIETQPYDNNHNIKSKVNLGWTESDKLRYQLTIQKRLRQSLQRQNQALQKQINFLNNFGASLRNTNNKKLSDQQNFSSNKDKILSRLNKKRDGVTGQSDSDSTGLYSGKTKYYEDSINQMYEQYAKRRNVPSLQSVYQITKNYFSEFQQNYSKILVLFNQSKGKTKSDLSSKVQDLLFLFQIPILYKQKPKQLLRSVSRQRSQQASRQVSKDNSLSRVRVNSQLKDQKKQIHKQDMLPEYKSPIQIF